MSSAAGAGVEHRDRPGAPGNSERRLHAFERDLELDEQDRGRLDQRRGPCDVADTEGTVGAGHNNDGVLAGRVESYVRDPGRMARVEAKVRDVDTFGDELGPDHLAEKVIAEQADHGCGHLLAGTGHGLVVALAPRDHGEGPADDGLARQGQPGRLGGQVHRQAPDDDDSCHPMPLCVEAQQQPLQQHRLVDVAAKARRGLVEGGHGGKRRFQALGGDVLGREPVAVDT